MCARVQKDKNGIQWLNAVRQSHNKFFMRVNVFNDASYNFIIWLTFFIRSKDSSHKQITHTLLK